MFFLTYNQDTLLRNCSLELGPRGLNFKKLVFLLDLVALYKSKESSTTRELVNFINSFIIMYDLFYFIWGRKFILSNLFFHDLRKRKVFFFTFLYEEFEAEKIWGNVGLFAAYKPIFQAVSQLYSSAISLEYKINEPTTVSLYYRNLLDYFFYFKPNLLLGYRDIGVACRSLLSFRRSKIANIDKQGDELGLGVVINSINLNYDEIKEV